MSITIQKAGAGDVQIIAPLFNAYRMFYKQRSNLDAAESFIMERLKNNESVIFIALDGGKAVGYTQLFPLFTSVGMQRIWLLNDLYVTELARGKGVGAALLNAAKEHGRQTNSRWLMLQTAVDNFTAQRAYESNGWKKDNDYYVYNFGLDE